MNKLLPSFYFICVFVASTVEDSRGMLYCSALEDDVFPPIGHVSGPHRSHRHVRDCQPAKYSNVTSESFPSHISTGNRSSNPVEVRYFSKSDFVDQRFVHGHQVIVSDPAMTISILEPQRIGGCSEKIQETVASSANQKSCLFAVNAGFFNISDGACLGNVVSDGREAFNSGGIQNVHFGIKRNGSLFFGYIPEGDALNETFEQLVGGVIWLVRSGENYVDTSKAAECPDSESTGTLQTFIDVISARTAIGHDSKGRIHIVQVEGKSYKSGLNLYEFADFLLTLGIVNAINLDGGGSATAVLNGYVINYPSDAREVNGVIYGVARNVSTIVCVSSYRCVPGCGLHGSCIDGRCTCDANWHGTNCQQLLCPGANCSKHGDCTRDGCQCHPGFYGDSCSSVCPKGRYGYECWSTCSCPGNQTTCDPVMGQCLCSPGFTGRSCESSCPLGSYGEACEGLCNCDDGCFCDPIDGSCDLRSPLTSWKEGQCFGDLMMASRKMDLVSPQELRSWLSAIVSLSIVASLSLILNFYFLYRCCETGSLWRPRQRNVRRLQHVPRLQSDDDEDDEDLSDGRMDTFRDGMPLMNLDANDSPRRSAR